MVLTGVGTLGHGGGVHEVAMAQDADKVRVHFCESHSAALLLLLGQRRHPTTSTGRS